MQLNVIETLSGGWSQMTRVALVISPSWFNATALVLLLEAALPWFDQNKILKLDLLVQRAANTKYNVEWFCLSVYSVCNVVMWNGSWNKTYFILDGNFFHLPSSLWETCNLKHGFAEGGHNLIRIFDNLENNFPAKLVSRSNNRTLCF